MSNKKSLNRRALSSVGIFVFLALLIISGYMLSGAEKGYIQADGRIYWATVHRLSAMLFGVFSISHTVRNWKAFKSYLKWDKEVIIITVLIVIVLTTGWFGINFKNRYSDNPFIGKWQAEIPSAQAVLNFDYHSDGTFTWKMLNVPAEQGGEGQGIYLVKDSIMITYLDFEGTAEYIFQTVDKNSIQVTEIDEVKSTGEHVRGNTAMFTRINK